LEIRMREKWKNLKLEESLKGGALTAMLRRGGYSAGHQSAIKIGDALGLDREGSMGGDLSVGVPLFFGGERWIFGGGDHGVSEVICISGSDKLAEFADGPRFRNSV
jgi:hypothetical protein